MDLLCAARSALQVFAPKATVVSAGLATTGRVKGSWNGHLGHDGTNQDEREYVKEFIAGGGMNCTDAVGYHPLGFRAAYSAAPDFNGGTPETDCSSGLCFRSMEKFAQTLIANGVPLPHIWATETGWLTPASTICQDTDPSWQGRAWQVVSPQAQAANLVGAFSYARKHWPWLDAMFVFNLDFNNQGYYQTCEQMRYYSITGRPAESALAAMPKETSRAFLPLIMNPAQAAVFDFHLSGLPRPWANCGSMGVFGIVSDAAGAPVGGLIVELLYGYYSNTWNFMWDRNYAISVNAPGHYQAVLYDPAKAREVSPRADVTIYDSNQCDIYAGQPGSQWVQVNFRHN